MAHFELKKGLLLGAATSATQIEGGDRTNSWYDWAEGGHIKDGSHPVRACGHWESWREDTELMADMGLRVYRFGVEWSRIEPENGVFDEAVMERYRQELLTLRENGIIPMITLHHFTNPRWFEALGGFESRECAGLFLRYVEKVVGALGDLCAEYITINEPNVYAFEGYVAGDWPPGKSDPAALRQVLTNFVVCHTSAYRLIHRLRRAMGFTDTRVSFANHLRVFDPRNRESACHRFFARAADTGFQGALTEAMMTGDCHFPVGDAGVPLGHYYDFIAINYYSRSVLYRPANDTRENCAKNDLWWEIYPHGIARLAAAMYKRYRAPIWITENGTADNADAFRSRFIFDHLRELCALDIPVERYYHWSFTDNFEWLEGESARFGLVRTDYETGEREIKQSGYFYAEIIENGGVTEDMYERYVKDERYPIR